MLSVQLTEQVMALSAPASGIAQGIGLTRFEPHETIRRFCVRDACGS